MQVSLAGFRLVFSSCMLPYVKKRQPPSSCPPHPRQTWPLEAAVLQQPFSLKSRPCSDDTHNKAEGSTVVLLHKQGALWGQCVTGTAPATGVKQGLICHKCKRSETLPNVNDAQSGIKPPNPNFLCTLRVQSTSMASCTPQYDLLCATGLHCA